MAQNMWMAMDDEEALLDLDSSLVGRFPEQGRMVKKLWDNRVIHQRKIIDLS